MSTTSNRQGDPAPATVLVTGSEGYIGAAVTAALKAGGHRVTECDIGMVRTEFDRSASRDAAFLTVADCVGADAVIHLAGLANDGQATRWPEAAEHLNVAVTFHAASTAKRAGVGRFVLASSAAVYGRTDGPAAESRELAPHGVYATTKGRAELAVSSLADDGFATTTLRLGNVSGPSPALRGDLVLHRLITEALVRGTVTLGSNGESLRPFVSLSDVADAFVWAAIRPTAGDVEHSIFNVVGPDGNRSVADAGRLVASELSTSPLALGSHIDPNSYEMSGAALTCAGFQPVTDLRSCVRSLAQWISTTDLTPESLRQAPYDRVEAMAAHVERTRYGMDPMRPIL